MLKTGSIPTKFCFVNEKQPRKPPKERTLVERKQKNFAKEDHVVGPKQHDHDKNMSNLDIERGMEEPGIELLRQRIKELDFSLENESTRRKNAEGTLEAKRFSVKSLAQDPKVFKFYTGFTEEKFYCLLDFLGDGTNSLTYWGSSGASNSNSEDLGGSEPGPSRKLTAEDEPLLCADQIETSTSPPPHPRANPGHLTMFCAQGVGNLICKAFPGVGI